MTILADGDDGSELYYVIAVLVLGALSAIFDKAKKSLSKSKAERQQGNRKFVIPPPQPAASVGSAGGAPRAAPVPQQRRAIPPVVHREQTAVKPRPPRRPMSPAEARTGQASMPRPAAREKPPQRLQPRPTAPPPRAQPVPPKARKTPPAPPPRPVEVESAAAPSQAPASAMQPAGPKTSVPRPSVDLAGIGSMRNLGRQDLRKAFVLHELLKPPVGLRGEDRYDELMD